MRLRSVPAAAARPPACPPPPAPAAPPAAPPTPAAPAHPGSFPERHDDPAQAEELERQQDA